MFAVSDPGLLVALCLLMAVSSALQTATGFGFAILSAPIGAVLLDSAAAAVSTVLVVGTTIDLLVLFLRRRPPAPGGTRSACSESARYPALPSGRTCS